MMATDGALKSSVCQYFYSPKYDHNYPTGTLCKQSCLYAAYTLISEFMFLSSELYLHIYRFYSLPRVNSPRIYILIDKILNVKYESTLPV